MSWSLAYSGVRSAIVDAYHRVILTFKASTLLSLSLDSLTRQFKLHTQHSLFHINLILDEQKDDLIRQILHSISHAIKAVSKPSGGEGTAKRFFLSLTCSLTKSLDLLPLLESPIDLLIIELPSQYQCVSLSKQTQEVLDQLTKSDLILYLGVRGFADSDEADSFMLTHREVTPKLQFICFDILNLPNIATMSLELVHSFQLNSILFFPENLVEAAANHPLYDSLSRKYNITPHLLILRVAMQLGALVAVSANSVINVDDSNYWVEWSRLAHPFVHRKDFLSAVHIISLLIAEEDVDVIVAASEESEMIKEKERLPLAITMPTSLPFSYN